MALGGTSIGWNENAPAATDPAGSGDDEIRSVKSNLRGALDSEHYWPIAGGAAVGYHRYGSARPYVGAASAVSSDGTDGRLLFSSTDSSFWYGSATSVSLIGGANVLVAPSGMSLTNRHANLVQSGIAFSAAGASVTTFPSSYSGVPTLFLQALSTTPTIMRVVTQSGQSFRAIGTDTAGGTVSNLTFYWMSMGTALTAVP